MPPQNGSYPAPGDHIGVIWDGAKHYVACRLIKLHENGDCWFAWPTDDKPRFGLTPKQVWEWLPAKMCKFYKGCNKCHSTGHHRKFLDGNPKIKTPCTQCRGWGEVRDNDPFRTRRQRG